MYSGAYVVCGLAGSEEGGGSRTRHNREMDDIGPLPRMALAMRFGSWVRRC